MGVPRLLPSTVGAYVAKRFLGAILLTFLVCSFLIYVIDLVEMLRQSGKRGGIAGWKIAWLTLLRLPAYTEFLLSFGVLVGSIGALLMLSRKSELAVIRAAGMSAWQFVSPALISALLFGIFATVIYNPLSAVLQEQSRKLEAEVELSQAKVKERLDSTPSRSVAGVTRISSAPSSASYRPISTLC